MGKRNKRKRPRQSDEAADRRRTPSTFDVLHEDVMLPPHATHTDPRLWYATQDERPRSSAQTPILAYLLVSLAALAALSALAWSRLAPHGPTDSTDASTIRTVTLARSIPAAEALDATIRVERDDRDRPTIYLHVTPKLEGAHDIRLKVDATVSGHTSDGDDYTQVIKSVPCDSSGTHVFSRDGTVQLQSVTSPRDVTLWPNFDHVGTKGTVERLEHIDVEVIDATPSASVIDALAPEECSIRCSLAAEGKVLHVSGTVRNPCDRTMRNARAILSTRSLSGGCAVPKNRDDIPWAYGAQMLVVPIGDIAIGESAHVDYDIDISQIDVTMATVSAIVADRTGA